ncbi:MAG: hypothetical protein INQ03_13930 [Candidatus Heimdallarchaeota archaeon]|nr:hypothetical protein [Candidatus Heimdallarchaeota archaeon]
MESFGISSIYSSTGIQTDQEFSRSKQWYSRFIDTVSEFYSIEIPMLEASLIEDRGIEEIVNAIDKILEIHELVERFTKQERISFLKAKELYQKASRREGKISLDGLREYLREAIENH